MKKFLVTLLIILFFPLVVFAKDEINIAFTIDDNYAPVTMLAINSILKKNHSDSLYNFYIFTNKLSSFNRFILKTYTSIKKQNIKFIDCSTDIIDGGRNLQEGILPEEEIYITRIGTARILIPELLPDVNRILYLDPDILVLSDIKELYQTDLGNKSIGMVQDVLFFDAKTYNPEVYSYVNSGVILINAEKWRNEKFTEKMINYAHTHTNLQFPDQDLFNIVLSDEIKMLDLIWNNQWLIEEDKVLKKKTQKGIFHYSYKIKPWNFLPHNSIRKQKYILNWSTSIFSLYQLYYLPKSIFSIYKNFIKEEFNYIKINK